MAISHDLNASHDKYRCRSASAPIEACASRPDDACPEMERAAATKKSIRKPHALPEMVAGTIIPMPRTALYQKYVKEGA